ncbi:hypothetical protein Tco_0738547 [Tanacetum coccineum]
MEAHLAPKQPIQVDKITSLCEIYSGPHNTQYCMENPEQTFVDYAYVVPTGRVIATVSIKVPTGRYIVPAGYIISPGRVT